MLTINLQWDANALAAPQSFRDGVQAAASILEAAIYDPISVNIGVGYGEYDDGSEALPGDISIGGTNSGNDVTVSYPVLLAALLANATSAADAQALHSLPDTTSLEGQSSFFISGAQAKALGALPPDDLATDGYVGFPTVFSGDVLIAAGIVEILHALGLADGQGVLSLFQYTSAGNNFFSNGVTSTTPAYFSLDGGHTNLANYDVGFDDTLFSGLSGDPLNVPDIGMTALTPLDLGEISAIGFDATSTPTLPGPDITPITTSIDVPASVTTENLAIGENVSIPVQLLIKSVSVPIGDEIASYGFLEQDGGGHFVFNGTIEPNNQYFNILDTQISDLRYVSGASAGSDYLDVFAFDLTADAPTRPSQLAVATDATLSASALSALAGPYVVALPSDAAFTASSPNETILLGGGASDVTLASTAALLYGDAGADLVIDRGGADSISLGSGSMTVQAATGDPDVFGNSTSGSLLFTGGTKAATVSAGAGATTVFANAGGGQFSAGEASSMVFVGGSGASTVAAGSGGSTLIGGGGGTTIQGGGGGQLIFGSSSLAYTGGAGAATIIGGATGNTVTGGGGNELVFASSSLTYGGASGAATIIGGGGPMNVNLGAGGGLVYGSPSGSDTLQSGSGPSILVGGGANDVLAASGGANDTMAAGAGAETLSGLGSTGNLVLFGGSGKDTLVGGVGRNLFIAEGGNDTMVGGGASDSYVFIDTPGTTRLDVVVGFNPGADAIGLFGYGDEPGIDQAALQSASVSGSNTVLSLTDGTKIVFTGAPTLTSSNFF